jgi:hypothetical protein
MATSALKSLARTRPGRGHDAVQLLGLMLQSRVETNVAHFSAGNWVNALVNGLGHLGLDIMIFSGMLGRVSS